MSWFRSNVKDESKVVEKVAEPIEVASEPASTSWRSRAEKALEANPYFHAGAGLALLGAGAAVARNFAHVGMNLLRRRFVLTLEVTNEDAAYPWLLDWLNRRAARSARQLSAHTQLRQSESGRLERATSFLPAHGTHYFLHGGARWIKVERTRAEKTHVQRDGIRTALETLTLSTIGTSPDVLHRLLDEAASNALQKVETGLVVYKAVGPDWQRFGAPRRKRPLDSVILRAGVRERLQKDLQEFARSQKWYVDRGVPYRRGYLFHGPPGTGKSTLIAALASHFGYSICMASLSEVTLDDLRLQHLLNTCPPHSIVVLEDVDAAFPVARGGIEQQRDDPMTRHPAAYEGCSRVTLSGLLNAIDGVGAGEERVLFMTTNHPERLDPALVRPGRVDVEQRFDDTDHEMRRLMFERFYADSALRSSGDADEGKREQLADAAQRFADATEWEERGKWRPISPAAVQGHFLRYKHDREEALEHAVQLLQAQG